MLLGDFLYLNIMVCQHSTGIKIGRYKSKNMFYYVKM